MKKVLLVAVAVLLVLPMLGGCSKPLADVPVATEPTATTVTTAATEPTQATTEETAPAETEGEMTPDFTNIPYGQQIARYYTAICEQWDEGAYFEQEMSPLVAYYYNGNALDNIGYAYVDLDGNGIQELIIGAIQNAEQDPLIFEVWTLRDGEPVMLVQSGSRNRHYLLYADEDQLWYIAYMAENGAANHAAYYLQMFDGELEVSQGIVFDAVANEDAPWFMTYDLDWDVSNDSPIDEDLAIDVIDAYQRFYTTAEYTSYSLLK